MGSLFSAAAFTIDNGDFAGRQGAIQDDEFIEGAQQAKRFGVERFAAIADIQKVQGDREYYRAGFDVTPYFTLEFPPKIKGLRRFLRCSNRFHYLEKSVFVEEMVCGLPKFFGPGAASVRSEAKETALSTQKAVELTGQN